MLRQEINFYRHFEAPVEQGYFTWKQFKLFNIVVIVGMIIFYQFAWLQNWRLKSTLAANEKQLIALQQQFQSMKKTLPSEFFGDDITKSVATMKKAMAAQEEIIAILGNHSAFSNDFISLSNTITDGVWLTEINIENYGNQITLSGEALNPDVLHEFISNCKADPNLQRYNITLHGIKDKDTKDDKSHATFTLELVAKS